MIYTIAGTGHRPGEHYDYSETTHDSLVELAVSYLRNKRHMSASHRPPYVIEGISGMALGWDMALAEAFTRLNIAWTAAVPFEGQESLWSDLHKKQYYGLLKQAKEVVYVCEPGYAAWKMKERNFWMLNRCDELAALYKEGESGGTAHTVDAALKRGIPVTNLWLEWSMYVE